MTELEKAMLEKAGITEKDVKPKEVEKVIEITREDFDLLRVEQEVIYHIFEADGSLTIKKGVNR